MHKERNASILEGILKEELARKCLPQVLALLKEKAERGNGLLNIISGKALDAEVLQYDHCFAVCIALAAEYEAIKGAVEQNKLNLEHISYEPYWDDESKIGKFEAIYFYYTFINELYPQMLMELQVISESPDPPALLRSRIGA